MNVMRLLAYLVLVHVLIMIVMGGWGMLLPIVFNLNTDLMFVLLPLAVITLAVVAYVVLRQLVRMIRTDLDI